MYSKMVPHHIEGMMMGFALSLIKFNVDVVGRCFTAALNIHFKVKIDKPVTADHGSSKAPATAHLLMSLAEGAEELLTPGLGKMYVIQAGLVIVPVFFVWLMVKRSRVEEVQVAIHHQHTHTKSHPIEPSISLVDAVSIVRATQQLRRTVNNDFNMLTQSLMKSRNDTEYNRKLSESRAAYSGQLSRVSRALKNAKSSQLPHSPLDISRITASLTGNSVHQGFGYPSHGGYSQHL
jgi:hypothetical protein